jgi:hypothetical protein
MALASRLRTCAFCGRELKAPPGGKLRKDRRYCNHACAQKRWRVDNPEHSDWQYRKARKAELAAARASASPPSPNGHDRPGFAPGSPEWFEFVRDGSKVKRPGGLALDVAALKGQIAEQGGQIAELIRAQGSAIAAAFGANLAAAEVEAGRPEADAHRARPIGPEHRHADPAWADRVCYCDDPSAPVPAGAADGRVPAEARP